MSQRMLHVAPLSPFRFSQHLGCVTLTAALMALGPSGCHREAGATQDSPVATPAALRAAALTDQDGQAHRFADFQGKTVVLDFFFASCPSVCPRETRSLADVQARLPAALRPRVQFISVTVDPENDSADRLKAFARANGADLKGWSFVRASSPATASLTKELEVFGGPQQAQAAPVGHGTSVYLFDARGHLMQRYAGSPLDGARLAREIAQLDDLLLKQDPELNKARL